MNGKEKMVFFALLMAAWVGLWMTGPEDPMATYGRYDWVWFWLGFVAIVVFWVRALSEYAQRRDAQKRASEWRRRDSRTDR